MGKVVTYLISGLSVRVYSHMLTLLLSISAQELQIHHLEEILSSVAISLVSKEPCLPERIPEV